MSRSVRHWFATSFVVAAVASLAACATDAPSGVTSKSTAVPATAIGDRSPELGSCSYLQADDTTKLAFHAYAVGVQIYRWTGTNWTFVGPSAKLYADANGNGEIGIHYAGPTWESVSGSKVVGIVDDRCTPDPTAIPWLSLNVVSSAGPGIFDGVTFIQRVNTVGGLIPSAPGSVVGETMGVPYSAEYYFYRAQ